VDSVGRSGGLALFWKEEFCVTIQNYSRRHINAIIKNPELVRNGNSRVSMGIQRLQSEKRRGAYCDI
jgi:hypothetical protein